MRLIEIAYSQLGKEEIPRGSNWGPDVKKYLNSVGLDFPASWCMAFVYWCVMETCKELVIKNPMVRTGGVLRQWREIEPKYRIPLEWEPKEGDIFIQDYGHGLGHTGIIERVEGDILHTIEGNTNDTGSREGYEVCRRQRNVGTINGLIRLNLESSAT